MKIRETILYLLNRIGPMTRDKLEFLLYQIDFTHFEKYEKPFFKNISWIKERKQPRILLNQERKYDEHTASNN